MDTNLARHPDPAVLEQIKASGQYQFKTAEPLGVGGIDDGRFDAVLEVTSADFLELRRGGDENAQLPHLGTGAGLATYAVDLTLV